jgi:hypothetical protein
MARIIFKRMGVDGFITYYIFMMAFIMSFLLLGLCWWNGRMISQGETSMERILHQNYQQTFTFPQMHRISLVENSKRFLEFGISENLYKEYFFQADLNQKGME